jgi:proteasome accessory factor C
VISESATERLARVLALVPYISRRPGVAIADLAAEFGVSEQQIQKDLDLLMVCGLPGYYPDDLIDVVLSEDSTTVSITFDAGLERPVRLTHDEAVALTVALRALAKLPGLLDADSVSSALAKLEQVGVADTAGVEVEAAAPAAALGLVREGLEAGRQLWMRYYTASRDAVGERTVDPLRLLVTDGQTYLEAYCHQAGGTRHFRVDRIEEVRLIDEPAQQPLIEIDDVPARMFHPDPAVPSATLSLDPGLRWFAEYYQAEELPAAGPHPGHPDAESPDAGDSARLRVRMRPSSDEWLIRQVLSLGGGAVIEDRPEVAAEVARRARAGLQRYS